MNCSAVEHSPFLSFRQPIARNFVFFRLLAASGDLSSCTLIYWKRGEMGPRLRASMALGNDDGVKAKWEAKILFPEESHYVKYYFELTDREGERRFFCEHGFTVLEPQTGWFELLQANESDVLSVPQWAKGCVYYQIFPERFAIGHPEKALRAYEPWNAVPTRDNFLGGDLKGICDHLPYLRELGVQCLYLNPIFQADFNHKYATTDYFHVDPDFGDDQDLSELVAQAHRLGLRVVLDGVFNHVGTHFPPFVDLVQNGEQSRYRDWFYPKRFPIAVDAECYECVGDYPYMPRLRVVNPQVREYVLSVLLHWLDVARIDGWRFDVADELDAAAVRYWREKIRAVYPDALMLAEAWGDASRLVCEGDQFDAAMNYLFRDAMIDYFAKGVIDEKTLDRRLQHMLMKYPDAVNGAMYNCLGSHDTERFLTACGGDKRRLQLAIAFQMTFPGSPAVYYGDEIGMAGGNDPDCRAGMRWTDGDAELLSWTRRMIGLRRQSQALRAGDYHVLLADPARHAFAFERRVDSERALVAFNMGDRALTLDFADNGGKVDVLPWSVEIVIK